MPVPRVVFNWDYRLWYWLTHVFVLHRDICVVPALFKLCFCILIRYIYFKSRVMLRMKSEQQVKRPTLMYFNTDTNSSRKTHHSIYGSAMKSNSSFSLSNNEKPREQCDEMTITQSSYNIERRMRKPLFKCVCIFVLTRRLFQRGFVMSGRQFCHIQISHRNPLFSFRVIKYKASRDG